jgi:hypothetical protein
MSGTMAEIAPPQVRAHCPVSSESKLLVNLISIRAYRVLRALLPQRAMMTGRNRFGDIWMAPIADSARPPAAPPARLSVTAMHQHAGQALPYCRPNRR